MDILNGNEAAARMRGAISTLTSAAKLLGFLPVKEDVVTEPYVRKTVTMELGLIKLEVGAALVNNKLWTTLASDVGGIRTRLYGEPGSDLIDPSYLCPGSDFLVKDEGGYRYVDTQALHKHVASIMVQHLLDVWLDLRLSADTSDWYNIFSPRADELNRFRPMWLAVTKEDK